MKRTTIDLIATAFRFACALLAVLTYSVSPTFGNPNVVLIMADDLGYHDLQCYGHPELKTPVLDKMAKDGVRLTNFHAGATVCTPSRMALLTGMYPTRLGWSKGVIGHIMPNGTGMHPNARTIAEIFQSQGYRTGIAGKWHLGDEAKFLPQRQGFDESLYITRSNNQTDTLWRDGEVVAKPFENRRLTENFTREAIRFIKHHHSKPFLLYLPYSAPHFPLEAHPDWNGHSTFGKYGDVVEEMDARIGEILETLDELDLAKNTIVVFLSDNGPEPMTKKSKATPYRGRKWDALEGGTRVPCIVRWPDRIPARQECDELISAMDLLPTLSHACGIDLRVEAETKTGNLAPKPLPKIDGVNVWASLAGDSKTTYPRKDLLYWHGAQGFQAIRVDNWKLFLKGRDSLLPSLRDSDSPALFNLKVDPEEMQDVSGIHPDIVDRLQNLAEKQLVDIRSNMIPLGE